MAIANFPLINTILSELEQVHKNIKGDISLQRKDKKLALYILTGRILTHCYAINNLLLNGFFGETGVIFRSVYETIFTAEYFNIADDDSEDLKKWFNDEIIKPGKVRKKQYNMLKNMLERSNIKTELSSPDNLNKYRKSIDELYRIASKYTHPTYKISKINMHHYHLEFDYACKEIKKDTSPPPYSFEQLIITIINMFCMCKDTFKMDKATYDKLRENVELLDSHTQQYKSDNSEHRFE